MKRAKLFTASCLLLLAGLAACSDDKPTEPDNGTDPGPVAVTIKASSPVLSDPTRTVIDGDAANGYQTVWEAGNAIGVFTSGTVSNTNRQFTIGSGGVSSAGTGTFTGSFADGTTGEVSVYAYYPYSTTAGSSASSVSVSVPAVQTMTRDSHDTAADVMVAAPESVDVDGETLEINGMSFRHLVAFSRWTASIDTGNPASAPIYGTDNVNKVTFETSGEINISGGFTIDLTTASASYPTSAAQGGNAVEVVTPSGTTVDNLGVWLVSLPFELQATDELTVTLHTDLYTIRNTVTGSDLSFAAGTVRSIELSIDADSEITEVIADTPDQLYITGDATEFTGGQVMRKVSDEVFEIYTSLRAGTYGFTDTAGGDIKYSAQNGNLAVDRDGITVSAADSGIYYIKADFASSTLTLEEITEVKWYYCWTEETADMNYIGNGTWSISELRSIPLTQSDERYKFRVVQNGEVLIWGHEEIDPVAPSAPDGSYYNIYVHSNVAEKWDYPFKYYTTTQGRIVDIVLNMSPDVEAYTHTVTAVGGLGVAPDNVYISGAATEYSSRDIYTALRKKGTNVFDIVSKMTPGTYSFNSSADGSGQKYVVDGNRLEEGDGDITFSDQEGIYRITLDFAEETVTYELITEVSHFMSATAVYTEMTYTGYGEWEIPSYPVVFFDMGGWLDERFHYRFKSDGVMHKWASSFSGGREFIYNNPEDCEFHHEWTEETGQDSWQWDWGWKFLSEHNGKNVHIKVTTWPDAGRTNYTQVITALN